MTFSSLSAPEVVKMTTSSAAINENSVKMTFPFQCSGRSERIIEGILKQTSHCVTSPPTHTVASPAERTGQSHRRSHMACLYHNTGTCMVGLVPYTWLCRRTGPHRAPSHSRERSWPEDHQEDGTEGHDHIIVTIWDGKGPCPDVTHAGWHPVLRKDPDKCLGHRPVAQGPG